MISRYVLIVLSAMLLLTGCEERVEIKPSGKVIKIGVIAALSGENDSIGKKAVEGLHVAQALHPLTEKGDRIELIIRDEGSNAGKATALLSELVNEEKVEALLNLSISGHVLTMTHHINKLALPTVVALASHEAIIEKSAYMTRVCMSNSEQAKVAAFFTYDELLLNRAAVLYDADSVYSSSLAQLFQNTFEKIGGEIIAKVGSENSDSLFKKELVALQQKEVKVLYTSLSGSKSIRLLQLLKKMDWQVKVIAADGFLGNVQEHGLRDKSLVEGVYIIENYADNVTGTAEEERLMAYIAKHNLHLNTHSQLAYESYLLLLKTLSECSENCENDELNSRLRQQDDFLGIDDRLMIKEGEAERPIFINKVHNGKMLMHLKVY